MRLSDNAPERCTTGALRNRLLATGGPSHQGPFGAAPSCLQRLGGVAVRCADGRRGQASGHPHWSGRRRRARCRVSDRGAALDTTRASAHGRRAARVRGSRGGGTQHPVATGRLGDRDAAGGVLNGLVERSRSSTLAVGPLSAGVAAVQPAAAARGLADPHRAAETAFGPVRHTGPTARCRSRYGAQIAQGWSLLRRSRSEHEWGRRRWRNERLHAGASSRACVAPNAGESCCGQRTGRRP